MIAAVANAPQLYVVPPTWNVTLYAGESTSASFDMCTNPVTSLTGVTFNTTGTGGAWVSNTTSLGAIPQDTCITKTFTLTVPSGTSVNAYTGAINAQGMGVAAQDSITISVQILSNNTNVSNSSDTLGPLAINSDRIPARPFVGDPVTITASCDDTARGNSAIRNATIRLDDNNPVLMSAIDGVFDEVTERVLYQFSEPSFGLHNITIQCADAPGNIGPVSLYNFRIMKEIILLKKDSGAGGSEGDWSTWINTHISGEGYLWHKDDVVNGDLVRGIFNINNYAIALIPDDIGLGADGGATITIVQNFVANGGYAVIVDRGAERLMDNFNLADSTVTTSSNSIVVLDNTHYITSPFVNGTVRIASATIQLSYPNLPFAGTSLAKTFFAVPLPDSRAVIGYNGGYLVWGAHSPGSTNANGTEISTRIIDYAIMHSQIGVN